MSRMQYRSTLCLVLHTDHSGAKEGEEEGGLGLPQPPGKPASSSVDELIRFYLL